VQGNTGHITLLGRKQSTRKEMEWRIGEFAMFGYFAGFDGFGNRQRRKDIDFFREKFV
jgi:hypothetical protein